MSLSQINGHCPKRMQRYTESNPQQLRMKQTCSNQPYKSQLHIAQLHRHSNTVSTVLVKYGSFMPSSDKFFNLILRKKIHFKTDVFRLKCFISLNISKKRMCSKIRMKILREFCNAETKKSF